MGYLRWALILIAALLVFGAMILAGYPEFTLLLGIAGLGGLFAIRYPKYWLLSVVPVLAIFSSNDSKGISVLDVGIAAFLNGGLLFWLIAYKLTNNNIKYIKGLPEFILVLFFVLIIPNSLIAFYNGVEPLSWFSFYLIISVIFYYIPFREYFKTDKDVKQFIVSLGVFLLLITLNHLYEYYTYTTNIEMAYQIAKGVRINLTILSTAVVTTVAVFFSYKGFLKKTISLGLIILSVGALITSFARTFWGTAIIGLGILFLVLSNKEKITVLLIFLIFVVVSLVALEIILGDIADLVLRVLEDRFTSSAKGKSDVSLQMRWVEYSEAFKQISYYPMGGKGFRSDIDFYIPQVMEYWNTPNIHNTYIYLMFKSGIPTMLLFTTSLIGLTYRSWKTIKLNKFDKFRKYLSVAMFSGFLTLIIGGFLANIVFYREGIVLLAIIIFLSSYLYYTAPTSKPRKLLTDTNQ